MDVVNASGQVVGDTGTQEFTSQALMGVGDEAVFEHIHVTIFFFDQPQADHLLQQGAWVDIFGDRLGQSLKAFDLVLDVFPGNVVDTVVVEMKGQRWRKFRAQPACEHLVGAAGFAPLSEVVLNGLGVLSRFLPESPNIFAVQAREQTDGRVRGFLIQGLQFLLGHGQKQGFQGLCKFVVTNA